MPTGIALGLWLTAPNQLARFGCFAKVQTPHAKPLFLGASNNAFGSVLANDFNLATNEVWVARSGVVEICMMWGNFLPDQHSHSM
jgi:hypothetical protein